MYNQNQEDILKYAGHVLENDFPVGVFMVDDNWQKYYGNFDFKPERFPDPKGMIDRLHRQGFKIMFWICLFVSPDSPEFRELQQKGFLIKKGGRMKRPSFRGGTVIVPAMTLAIRPLPNI